MDTFFVLQWFLMLPSGFSSSAWAASTIDLIFAPLQGHTTLLLVHGPGFSMGSRPRGLQANCLDMTPSPSQRSRNVRAIHGGKIIKLLDKVLQRIRCSRWASRAAAISLTFADIVLIGRTKHHQSRPPPLQNPHQVEYDLAPLVYHQNIEIEIIFSNTQ